MEATTISASDVDLKLGDRVTLRSGGPVMTVADVGGKAGFVWCEWMDDDGVLVEPFRPEMLNTGVVG